MRQLLSHQAGLPVIDVPFTIADLADLDLVAAALALQQPMWPPGIRHGYHGISLGWYEGELLRRVDPVHRSLGTYFAQEIARPLDLDFWIGIPPDFDLDRRATLVGLGPWSALFGDTPRAVAAAYSAALEGRFGLTRRTLEALSRPARAPEDRSASPTLKPASATAMPQTDWVRPSSISVTPPYATPSSGMSSANDLKGSKTDRHPAVTHIQWLASGAHPRTEWTNFWQLDLKSLGGGFILDRNDHD